MKGIINCCEITNKVKKYIDEVKEYDKNYKDSGGSGWNDKKLCIGLEFVNKSLLSDEEK